MAKGMFITFEGIEGCGKTTQMRRAAEYLTRCGVAHIRTEEPGGTPLGRKIREILLNRTAAAIGAEAELLLFHAARAQHVRERILPALEAGRWILCDRFADATEAYQGFGRGLDLALLRNLHGISTGGLVPERTFLFDVPVAIGLGRARQRAERLRAEKREDRFETEDPAFHERVREGYLALARAHPSRFLLVDASRGVDDIHAVVREDLASWVAQAGGNPP